MLRVFVRAVASLALAAGMFTAIGTASAALITFTDDPLGNKPNGWSPVEHPYVEFHDTVGNGLRVGDYGSEAIDDIALRIFTHGDGSKLEIRFAFSIDRLSLWFGNDEHGRTKDGDLAYLEIFDDGDPVGATWVELNRNNKMDQEIGIWGHFDMARFSFTDANFNPTTGPGSVGTGTQENVDNIFYSVVPEPGILVMFAGGLLGLVAARRRRTAEF